MIKRMNTKIFMNTLLANKYCTFVTDGTHDSPKPQSSGRYLITSKHLGRYQLDFQSANFISEEDYLKIITRSSVEQWDILYSMIGTIGNIYIETNPAVEYACKNMGIFKLGGDSKKAKWLYYYLQSPMAKAYIAGVARGTTQGYVPLGALRNLPIEVPSDDRRDKIVRILWNLDKKIRTNIAINEILEQQIEALLLAFLDNKDAIPVKLGDYLYIKGRIGWKGLKKSEYLSQSGYRIINGETLTKSGIDWNKAGYISEERYIESPEIMLKVGDILLSKDGTIGKIGYVDSLELPTSVASGIFVIRNNKPDIISTTFIYYLLKSRFFESFIAARTEGSVIPHLYQKDFMEFEFPLPSSDKMAEFEELTEPMFSQIVNNLNENKKLAALRDGLLPKLMSGELDVSNLVL